MILILILNFNLIFHYCESFVYYTNKSILYIINSVYYITHVYMHLPYNNTSYTLCDFSPLSIIEIDSLTSNSFPLFNDMHSYLNVILQD